MSFIIPKKPQILYAPMLASFGGGSARGFNPGGGPSVSVEGAHVIYGAGATSFTVPAGVYAMRVVIVAGGAGGATFGAGSGGGAAMKLLEVSPGESISYQLGLGGAGCTSGTPRGNNGGVTNFSNLSAGGGTRGPDSQGNSVNEAGPGAGSGGTVNGTGGYGMVYYSSDNNTPQDYLNWRNGNATYRVVGNNGGAGGGGYSNDNSAAGPGGTGSFFGGGGGGGGADNGRGGNGGNGGNSAIYGNAFANNMYGGAGGSSDGTNGQALSSGGTFGGEAGKSGADSAGNGGDGGRPTSVFSPGAAGGTGTGQQAGGGGAGWPGGGGGAAGHNGAEGGGDGARGMIYIIHGPDVTDSYTSPIPQVQPTLIS